MKTAYKAKQFIDERDLAYGLLDLAYQRAKKEGWRQQRLRDEVHGIFNMVPQYPLSLRAQLIGYDDCLSRKMREDHVFLYSYKGQFYCTKHGMDQGIPHWQEIPVEVWPDLGRLGGTYWKGSLKPFFTYEGDEQ